MFTPEELATVPSFAKLDAEQLAELSREAADIHLKAGEYAVNEGDEAALYVVIEGAFEVTKLIDGQERVIGKRTFGQIFGEVPLVYGTAFQSSCRAIDPSRVLRLDVRDYHSLVATSPKLSEEVCELARQRIGGLQKIVADAHNIQVLMFGNRWDSECLTVRRFLSRNQIAFDWVTPGSPEARTRWIGPHPKGDEGPTLRFANGNTVVKPKPRALAELLGLQTEPLHTQYDTIIIGAGPAGLAAAVYGASEGLRTIVIEREGPGGQAGTSSRIENYLGFPNGISGEELATRALRQAKRLGAEILIARQIEGVDLKSRTVTLDGGEVLHTRTAVVATGVSWRRLTVEGFDRLMGKGIYYGAAQSEASTMQGADIHLIGAGNSAGQAAMFFANHARTVTLICRGDALEKSMSQYLVDQIRGKSNIRLALQTEVQGVHGDDHLIAVNLLDNASGDTRREDSGGLFVFIGADAETEWLPADIKRDPRGYVLTGSELQRAGGWPLDRDPYLLETSVPGIFACGDVRLSPVKRVAAAVGEGSMSIAFVHQYLHTVANGSSPAQ